MSFDPNRPLVIRGLCKSFTSGRKPRREIRAVDDVSLDVPPRAVYGLIGANGSGKSTLIRVLSTLVLADAGEVSVFGYDVQRDSMQARQLINRVSADPSFFRQMSALENLLFFGKVYGLASADVRRRSVEICDRLGLGRTHQRQMVKELSRGQQQKIAVARAFLTSPVLMLLDEPTTGLDPQARHAVWERLRVLRDGGATLVLTTHYMDEAAQLCDRLVIMDHGRIVRDGRPADLVSEEVGREVLELRVAPADAPVLLDALGARVRGHEQDGDLLLLFGDDAEDLHAAARRTAVPIRLQSARPAGLEDVFLRLTGRRLRDG
jgi:ABC-type multidrug transport system ATPase subunit